MHRRGFRLRAGRVLTQAHDEHRNHHVRIVEYSGEGEPGTPFVEAWETHRSKRPARIVALSELVHLLQNVGDLEFWQITSRDAPK